MVTSSESLFCASYSRVCTFYAYIYVSCIKYIYIYITIYVVVSQSLRRRFHHLFAASSLSVRHSADDGPVTGFKKENGGKKNKKTVFLPPPPSAIICPHFCHCQPTIARTHALAYKHVYTYIYIYLHTYIIDANRILHTHRLACAASRSSYNIYYYCECVMSRVCIRRVYLYINYIEIR